MPDPILNCSHCGNKTPHEILYKATGIEIVHDVFAVGNNMELDEYYYLTQCVTCKGVSLYLLRAFV